MRDTIAAQREQQRTAAVLVFFKDITYRKAADELNLPVGMVRSRIHSAVKRLGEAWEEAHTFEGASRRSL